MTEQQRKEPAPLLGSPLAAVNLGLDVFASRGALRLAAMLIVADFAKSFQELHGHDVEARLAAGTHPWKEGDRGDEVVVLTSFRPLFR